MVDTSAYKDETLDVIFAAVPVAAPNMLCLIIKIGGVTVVE